jgi:histidinol-phosphatase (PHP family)
MFDLHIHTLRSVDSKQTIDEVCESAIQKGLKGIAVCDHVDMWFSEKLNTPEAIGLCVQDVRRAREAYGDRLEILQGVEMAEYLSFPEKAESILSLTDFDMILGSVHSLYYEDIDDAYSRVDFSVMPEEKIKGFLKEYFFRMKEMIDKTDFDVLSHLTCPLRYINGKYHRNIDAMAFVSDIREILDMIIGKDIAMEINTSGVGGFYNEYMPDRRIWKLYAEMGGKKITIGSDAHVPQSVGNAFPQTMALLQDMGFSHYCVFRGRQAQERPLAVYTKNMK